MEHGDLETPPVFKFEIIGSFKDVLSRQVFEAVRIENRGQGILNSKAEFNRCRIPRLRIDMEGWKKSKESTEHDNTIPEGWKAGSQDESSEESELRRIEESMRAEVVKRKEEEATQIRSASGLGSS